MSCNQRPDHSTIASFVSSMKDEILPLFRDILLVCEEEKLLGRTFFALDGLKLPSNASKQWSGTISDIKKKKQKIEQKVKRLLEEQIETDKSGNDDLTKLSNREKQTIGPLYPQRKSEAPRPKGRGFCLTAVLRAPGKDFINFI